MSDYAANHMILNNPAKNPYQGAQLIEAPDTSSWYRTNYGCIRTDPTLISRHHSFPDAVIPRGIPEYPAPPSRLCSDTICSVPISKEGVGCVQYRTAWPQLMVDPEPMMEAAMNHPQFAFSAGGPGTVYQIDVESQLRRLDQPLTNCQAVIPEDAPLFRNTVAPPPVSGVSEGVQNAANPMAAMIKKVGAEECRIQADAVATAMSGRWLNNGTRQDTKRFALPFVPPGIGHGPSRPMPLQQLEAQHVSYYS